MTVTLPRISGGKVWDLHKEPAVESSVKYLRSKGEKIPDTKTDLIEAHFRRVDRVLEKKPGYLVERVRDLIHKNFVIDLYNEDGSENTEKIDRLIQGLFESEKEILRQQGHGATLEQYGDTPRPEDYIKYKEQVFKKREEQVRTLNNWIDYLGTEEGKTYPTWFKYTVLRSLGKMGSRDRDQGTYGKRSASTIDPFPELSKEALAKTLDIIHQHEKGVLKESPQVTDQELLSNLETYADRGDFARLYAHFQNEIEQIRRKKELSEGVAGEWKLFPKDSDAHELVAALDGKGTEWCIAGLDMAESYLRAGDIWVYFSEDAAGQPVDPRVCVRLVNGQVQEVRGVVDKAQNLEPQFIDIAKEKYQQFPGGEKYDKRASDMKRVTEIEKRVEAGQEMTKEDLRFLYELDGKIEGFGSEKDPRIEQLLRGRDVRGGDFSYLLDVSPEKISLNEKEALKGDAIYHYGNLYLSSLTSAEGLTLPESIGGDLYLESLTSADKDELRQRYPTLKIY